MSSFTARLPEARPLLVAHRAGNDLGLLRRAEGMGADLVEADVWLYRRRLELRHLKTLGPVPVLWDRWMLTSGWGPRLQLHRLLAEARPETALLLDLKGFDPRLAARVVEALDRPSGERRIVVCSRSWRLLAPFARHPRIGVVHSVGSERQLRAVWARLDGVAEPGVSIHARLLTPEIVRAFKERGAAVIPWAVVDEGNARKLLAWGVDGINGDDLAWLGRLRG
jgi:glycerophosphoryl diester phosphodiesterase